MHMQYHAKIHAKKGNKSRKNLMNLTTYQLFSSLKAVLSFITQEQCSRSKNIFFITYSLKYVITIVVYFNQLMGALNCVCWLKYLCLLNLGKVAR